MRWQKRGDAWWVLPSNMALYDEVYTTQCSIAHTYHTIQKAHSIQNTKGKQIDFLFKPNIIGENAVRRRGKKTLAWRADSFQADDEGKKMMHALSILIVKQINKIVYCARQSQGGSHLLTNLYRSRVMNHFHKKNHHNTNCPLGWCSLDKKRSCCLKHAATFIVSDIIMQ